MSLSPRLLILQLLFFVRRSPLRQPLLRLFCRLHNSAYHWFSFFAGTDGPHPKHAITNYHQFFLDNIEPTDHVVDLGCGLGELTADLGRRALTVIGVDLSSRSIAKAQHQYRQSNLHFIVGDITVWTPPARFDIAVLSNVLEHVRDRLQLLRSIQSYADKILIRVPLISRDWITVYKHQHGFEYRLDDTHFIEYTPESFLAEITQANLFLSSWYVSFGELYAVCLPPSHRPYTKPSNTTHLPPFIATHQPSSVK